MGQLMRFWYFSHMGPGHKKTVFEVSDPARLKTACSTTETSWNGEILLVVSFDIILSNKQST